MASTKLQSVVQRQLPEFIREDYPVFTDFLKAYYEYLDIVDDRDIIELRDIDSTVDGFIDYFKGEIGFNTPTFDHIDMRLFLRKSKQAFVSKGTEESYKFLFRILFNKPVEITYPWDSVLKASDGKWNRDTSIFVQFPNSLSVTATDIIPGITYRIIQLGTTDFTKCGSPNNQLNTTFIATKTGLGTGVATTDSESQVIAAVNTFIGNQVTVKNSLGTRSVAVSVDKITKIRTRIYELSIDKNYYGDILIGDSVNFGNYAIPITPTTVAYKILNPGINYKVGELVQGSINQGGVIITQTLKVSKIDSSGGIVAVVPVKFGCGYTSDFYLLTSKQNISTKSSATLKDNTTQAVLYSTPETGVGSYVDRGTLMTPDTFETDYTNPTYAGTSLKSFFNTTVNNSVDMTNMALISCSIGAVAKYQGYYSTNDGFLNDAIKLQDSEYYQKFSYVITVDESIEAYRSYVKSFLHSAGTAMFGEYQISNTYNPGVSGQMIMGLGY